MTTNVSQEVAGADGTMAQGSEPDEYFGCGVRNANFRAVCGMAGVDRALIENKKTSTAGFVKTNSQNTKILKIIYDCKCLIRCVRI